MRLLFILLFVPFMSFSQIIVDKKLGEIDIRNINDKYITVELDQIIPASHLLFTSEYKKVVIRIGRKKKWNVYDNGVLISLSDKTDVLNFFSKYGYQLATSDTESTPVNYGNGIIGAVHQNTLTLMKVSQ